MIRFSARRNSNDRGRAPAHKRIVLRFAGAAKQEFPLGEWSICGYNALHIIHNLFVTSSPT
jgi:hypothetical protein